MLKLRPHSFFRFGTSGRFDMFFKRLLGVALAIFIVLSFFVYLPVYLQLCLHYFQRFIGNSFGSTAYITAPSAAVPKIPCFLGITVFKTVAIIHEQPLSISRIVQRIQADFFTVFVFNVRISAWVNSYVILLGRRLFAINGSTFGNSLADRQCSVCAARLFTIPFLSH